jgi:hypothetical protein
LKSQQFKISKRNITEGGGLERLLQHIVGREGNRPAQDRSN